MKIKGIIHLGAHLLEERAAYQQTGAAKVVWIEGNTDIYEQGLKIIGGDKSQQLYNYLISDNDDQEVAFHIANNGQSSSIFELDKHKEYHPDIEYIDSVVMKTATMKSIIQKENIDIDQYNFLTVDLQGADLLALKSFKELLHKIDYIYTEVNLASTYKDNPLIGDIDAYLASFGFKRFELALASNNGWGDAFYLKKGRPGMSTRIFLYKVNFRLRLFLKKV